jgi:hypothetical protein
VDETGLDIIDALDIFMGGAATQDTSCGDTSCGSTCCGHKNSLQVSRSSSPAADILASRGILAAQMASSQSSSSGLVASRESLNKLQHRRKLRYCRPRMTPKNRFLRQIIFMTRDTELTSDVEHEFLLSNFSGDFL